MLFAFQLNGCCQVNEARANFFQFPLQSSSTRTLYRCNATHIHMWNHIHCKPVNYYFLFQILYEPHDIALKCHRVLISFSFPMVLRAISCFVLLASWNFTHFASFYYLRAYKLVLKTEKRSSGWWNFVRITNSLHIKRAILRSFIPSQERTHSQLCSIKCRASGCACVRACVCAHGKANNWKHESWRSFHLVGLSATHSSSLAVSGNLCGCVCVQTR